MSLRLVVADDHSVVLQGLSTVLSLEPDLEVVALCTDGLEALEAVAAHAPDVLVMDATMPRCEGLEAHERLRAQGVRVPTVILTASLTDANLLRCLRASVDGIVLKESVVSVLVEAIRTVARGKRWIPPELTARALDLMEGQAGEGDGALTQREREVVLQVASGKSNRRVAGDLGIAESTVKLHLHHAFGKLQVTNRVQLSLLARKRGWI